MFAKTVWFEPDLTLVVRDYGTAILFAMGPGSVREALECVLGRCICRCSATPWTKWHATRRCRRRVSCGDDLDR